MNSAASAGLHHANPGALGSYLATKPHKLCANRQEQLRRLAASGEPVHELAKAFGIGRVTAYRYLSSGEMP